MKRNTPKKPAKKATSKRAKKASSRDPNLESLLGKMREIFCELTNRSLKLHSIEREKGEWTHPLYGDQGIFNGMSAHFCYGLHYGKFEVSIHIKKKYKGGEIILVAVSGNQMTGFSPMISIFFGNQTILWDDTNKDWLNALAILVNKLTKIVG